MGDWKIGAELPSHHHTEHCSQALSNTSVPVDASITKTNVHFPTSWDGQLVVCCSVIKVHRIEIQFRSSGFTLLQTSSSSARSQAQLSSPHSPDGSQHFTHNLHSMAKRRQLALELLSHPKQLRMAMSPFADHPTLPYILSGFLLCILQHFLATVVASREQQSLATPILDDLDLFPPSSLASVGAKRQSPPPICMGSRRERYSISLLVSLNKLWLSWGENDGINAGSVVP